MQHDRLTIKVLQGAELFRGHREEHQTRQLEDDPNRSLGPLHGGIGRTKGDIHIAAQNSLNGQFFFGEGGPFIVHPVRLGAIQRHEESGHFIRRRLSQRNADGFGLRGRHKHRGRKGDTGELSKEGLHDSPP